MDRIELVSKIINRFIGLFPVFKNISVVDLKYDLLLVTSKKENKFSLEKLSEENDLDFIHDIVGLNDALNRETGIIESYFVPRCQEQEEV